LDTIGCEELLLVRIRKPTQAADERLLRCVEVAILGPLHARIGVQREGLEHLLELVDHAAESLTIHAWNRSRRSELPCGFEAIAVDAKLQTRVKVATVHTWATAMRPLPRVHFTLKTVPCLLLGRIQSHTTSRPSVATPLGTLGEGVHNLL
jgi:hypothetical protein